MDYLLIALGGFLFGVYIQTNGARQRRRRLRMRKSDGAARQVKAFLSGMKAFERGVEQQIEREQRAQRMIGRAGHRN